MALDEQIEKVREERQRQERTRERLLALAADGVERLRPYARGRRRSSSTSCSPRRWAP
ncbi:hypothetical protein [Streptomyces sp. NPDC059513]|uniref:hypothetical protein n=1 Tax=unclassified Streptomyces TaxID=2593676 RepID=UPI00369A1C71